MVSRGAVVVAFLVAAAPGCGADETAAASGGAGAAAGAAGVAGGTGGGAGAGGAGGSAGTTGGSAGTTGGSAGTTGGSAGTTGGSAGSGAASALGDGGVSATTDGGGKLCPSLGWCEITDTKLADVCPDEVKYASIQANEGCSAVINDWSGGAQDPSRNRLIVWGGGHGGYFGNELYALDLNLLKMVRLNDPSDVTGYDFNDCYAPDAYPDGRPASRHTYDGLAYIAHAEKMYAFSGAKAPCGYQGSDTWTLDLATVTTAPAGRAAPWALVSPQVSGGTLRGGVGVVADYDPTSKQVIMSELLNVWSYDIDTNRYTLLNDQGASLDYHMTGRVDPKRKLFFVMGASGSPGGGLVVFDIASGSTHARQSWTSQVAGCEALLSAIYPGLAYDPVQDKLVGWPGGDSVYLFDPDAKSCTKVTYPGGPGPQNANGTNGRFRYFPGLNVFALVNDWKQNAFTLRLTP